MSELKKKCKRILPQVLRAIKSTNGIENIYFLTSKTYTDPFRGKLENTYRIVLFDYLKNEIRGYMLADYYREAGYLFASIVLEKILGSAYFVGLEVV